MCEESGAERAAAQRDFSGFDLELDGGNAGAPVGSRSRPPDARSANECKAIK